MRAGPSASRAPRFARSSERFTAQLSTTVPLPGHIQSVGQMHHFGDQAATGSQAGGSLTAEDALVPLGDALLQLLQPLAVLRLLVHLGTREWNGVGWVGGWGSCLHACCPPSRSCRRQGECRDTLRRRSATLDRPPAPVWQTRKQRSCACAWRRTQAPTQGCPLSLPALWRPCTAPASNAQLPTLSSRSFLRCAAGPSAARRVRSASASPRARRASPSAASMEAASAAARPSSCRSIWGRVGGVGVGGEWGGGHGGRRRLVGVGMRVHMGRVLRGRTA